MSPDALASMLSGAEYAKLFEYSEIKELLPALDLLLPLTASKRFKVFRNLKPASVQKLQLRADEAKDTPDAYFMQGLALAASAGYLRPKCSGFRQRNEAISRWIAERDRQYVVSGSGDGYDVLLDNLKDHLNAVSFRALIECVPGNRKSIEP